MSSYAKGVDAERQAYRFLTQKGYTFCFHRYKTPYGEIDLIMAHKKTLIFVEVKQRQTLRQALTSITDRQKERIRNAALLFLHHNADFSKDVLRFDSVLVIKGRIVYIENII